jgi:tripartite ATP-independent transporter DctM subunit
MIETLDRWSLAATSRAASLGVLGILGVSAVTVFDVMLRWLFNRPIDGLNEVTSLLLALGVAACLPAGMASRSNIVIDYALDWMPARVARWLRVLAAVLLLLFLLLVVWRMVLICLTLIGQGRTTPLVQLPLGWILLGITAVMATSILAQAVVVIEIWVRTAGDDRSGAALFLAMLVAAIVLAWPSQAVLAGLVNSLASLPSHVIAIIFFALMWIIILIGVPLGAATGLTGLLGTMAILGSDPGLTMLGTQVRSVLVNDSLAVLPLFLLMGAFAAVAGLSSDIYRMAYSLVGHWRGGLAHATVVGCAGFGALTGSSLATSATIGKVALPEMEKRGYAISLAAGTVAAGGTLGQLIPPSTVIVVYALLTEQSIGTLFIATIVPALLATALYLGAVAVTVHRKPSIAPPGPRANGREIVNSILAGWQVFALIGTVILGLYLGIFTETEAASFGAFGAFVVALLRRKINRQTIWAVMAETTSTIAVVYVLIFGAVTFSYMMGIAGIPDFLSRELQALVQSPLIILIAIIAVYLMLGMVMDSFAVMIITAPVFAPLMLQLNYDPIWWAIMTVCLVETGMITPPFGLNLFILNALNDKIKLSDVYRGVTPFVFADIVKIVLLILFPALVLWLPATR